MKVYSYYHELKKKWMWAKIRWWLRHTSSRVEQTAMIAFILWMVCVAMLYVHHFGIL